MQQYIIDFEKEASVGISGTSGSGKSYLTSYLLTQLNNSGAKLVAIDPKSDDLSLLAKKLNIECLNTSQYETTSDFVESVNQLLSKYINRNQPTTKRIFSYRNTRWTQNLYCYRRNHSFAFISKQGTSRST